MTDRDRMLDYLEDQIPSLAESAVNIAYWNALAAGLSVLISEKGTLYEVFPDGTRKFVKQGEPWVRVTPGTIGVLQ